MEKEPEIPRLRNHRISDKCEQGRELSSKVCIVPYLVEFRVCFQQMDGGVLVFVAHFIAV